METQAFRRVLWSGLLLAGLGWAGVVVLWLTTYPVLWARWAFFLCLVLGVAGTLMPVLGQTYRRFSRHPVGERTVLREGLLLGVYVAWLAWLQLGRLLTPATAAGYALVFLALEVVFRLWEVGRGL